MIPKVQLQHKNKLKILLKIFKNRSENAKNRRKRNQSKALSHTDLTRQLISVMSPIARQKELYLQKNSTELLRKFTIYYQIAELQYAPSIADHFVNLSPNYQRRYFSLQFTMSCVYKKFKVISKASKGAKKYGPD